MATTRPSAPTREPLVDEHRLVTNNPWLAWLRGLRQDIDAAPAGFDPVILTGQHASLGTTAIPTDGDLSAGVYRVTVYQRITTVAVTSSSLQTAISWTDGGVACSMSGTALTGNTTGTVGSFTFTMRIDAASPISYATTYASNGAGEMRYRLNIQLERLSQE